MRIHVALLALAACSDPVLRSTTSALESNDLFALERAASDAFVADRPDQVAELDAAADELVREAFATKIDTTAGHELVVRAATVQWARLVRRYVDAPLHTVVPGLGEDPDCRGSLIGDHALIDYADAIAAKPSQEATVRAVAALQTLGRHTACLGQRQHLALAAWMKVAADEVGQALQQSGRGGAVPYFVHAIAQPMLLVHDTERIAGPYAPLARWFIDHAAILSEGASFHRHPAQWHGLWLYDRITGRLRGFEATPNGNDENSVDLVALHATIVDELTIKDGRECTLSEMIQRGVDRNGRYRCDARRCENGTERECGVSYESDPREDGGGISIPGFASSSALACITHQVAQPGTRQMTCVLEATGRAASPSTSPIKERVAVGLAGVKLGTVCQLSARDPAVDAAIAAAEAAFLQAMEGIQFHLGQLTNALIAAQQVRDQAFQQYGANSPQGQAAQADVDKAEEEIAKAAAAAEQQKQLEREKRRKAIELALSNTTHQGSGASSGSASHAGSGSSSGSASHSGSGSAGSGSAGEPPAVSRCGPNSSCSNGCSAMEAYAQALTDCFEDRPDVTDPYTGPGGCGKACDPIEPTTDLPSGAQCITALAEHPNAFLGQLCWDARCGSADRAGAGSCCGPDGRTSSGELELSPLCHQMRCDDGSAPTVTNGHCECGGGFAPDGPVIPPDFGTNP